MIRAARRRIPLLLTLLLTAAAVSCLAVEAPASPAARTAPGGPPPASPAVVDTPARAQTVVLLHGLGRTHRSMAALERSLGAAGYRVVNVSYPSRHHPVRALVDSLAAELEACCAADPRPIHFVTHSLGGILVRAYAADSGARRVGRVVMLSPPNHGSEVVDRLPEPLLELVLGPAALQLGTDSSSLVHRLPPIDFELGIITGDGSINPLFSWWLPGEDDGRVTVESARVEGAEDFLVVPFSHTWIMRRDRVIEQVLAFLATGRFLDRESPAALR